ncbi:M23 family metallopeptidase [Mechercharimyces sp. CAU 1602]|nr:M23 family metallopeptidase [Mechercharimyces sp. CAU 1602]
MYINSDYGPRWGAFHGGWDLKGAEGTPMFAAEGGKVIRAGASNGYGTLIIIHHEELNLYTWYAHSWQRDILVKVGDKVERGEQISSVGNNGKSTGPHLHWEVRYGGVPGTHTNPRPYLDSDVVN